MAGRVSVIECGSKSRAVPGAFYATQPAMSTASIPADSIIIRPVAGHDEIRAVEALQREVWDLPDTEVVPLHLLTTAARNGGLLLGAFDRDRLAGFVFGFAGLTAAGRLKHCSHMAGVHPDYRDQNLGYRLKLAQREYVLVAGYRSHYLDL